jgi:hypothetical protein
MVFVSGPTHSGRVCISKIRTRTPGGPFEIAGGSWPKEI